MFINPMAGWERGEPQRPERRQRPLRFYLTGTLRTPTWTMSDIAIDRPLWRGLGLLAGSLGTTGMVMGATGMWGLEPGVSGALRGAASFAAAGFAVFVFLTVILHGAARTLEGEATILESLTVLSFAVLPLYLLVLTALLRPVAGDLGGFVVFLGAVAATVWSIRLAYLGIREAHRFLGTQSVLTLMMPPLAFGLLAIGVFFLLAFGTLIFG